MNLMLPRLQRLPPAQAVVLVEVTLTEGSVPREAGTCMVVCESDFLGSIGGGHLELQAIERARRMLLAEPPPSQDSREQRLALGPSLGQCCGGVVYLRYELTTAKLATDRLASAVAKRLSVALFGGGHVGKALASLLATLPVDLHWIDSREEIFPTVADHVRCEHSEPVQAAVDDVLPGSAVVAMSFSHAEDLEIVAQCLERLRRTDDLCYIGLIGSKTKWASFRSRLKQRGYTDAELSRVTCPIGLDGINGKEPEVIATAVAAQLLQLR